MEGKLFCKPCFKKMFKLKVQYFLVVLSWRFFSLISTCTFQGNYDEGFGKEQHKMKWLKDEQGQNANSEC